MTVMTAGRSSGKMTWKNRRSGDAPSMIAASSSSRGMLATNARKIRTENGSRKATSTRVRPISVLNSPIDCRT